MIVGVEPWSFGRVVPENKSWSRESDKMVGVESWSNYLGALSNGGEALMDEEGAKSKSSSTINDDMSSSGREIENRLRVNC